MSRRRIIAAACFIASAWVAFSVYGQVAAGHSADSTVQQLRDQNAALQSEIDARQRAIQEASGDVWLAEEARKRGYVLPGERVYVPVVPSPSLPPDGGVDRSELAPPATPTPTSTVSPAAAATVTASPVTAVPASPTPYVVVVAPSP